MSEGLTSKTINIPALYAMRVQAELEFLSLYMVSWLLSVLPDEGRLVLLRPSATQL